MLVLSCARRPEASFSYTCFVVGVRPWLRRHKVVYFWLCILYRLASITQMLHFFFDYIFYSVHASPFVQPVTEANSSYVSVDTWRVHVIYNNLVLHVLNLIENDLLSCSWVQKSWSLFTSTRFSWLPEVRLFQLRDSVQTAFSCERWLGAWSYSKTCQ